jgi:hypothetical protein
VKTLKKSSKPLPYNSERERKTKHRYKLTQEEYDALIAKALGECAICKERPPEGKRLVIDHNHLTNKIRGLLCHNCNAGLGFFKDSSHRLREAVRYLYNTIEVET